MLATSLVIGSFIVFITAIVSGMLGWVLREYMMYLHDRPTFYATTHPEMYDENGNIIPDSVIAFRFDPTLDEDDDL